MPREASASARVAHASDRQILQGENAATAIEYGLIAAGISVAVISVISGLGAHLKTTFTSVSSALK